MRFLIAFSMVGLALCAGCTGTEGPGGPAGPHGEKGDKGDTGQGGGTSVAPTVSAVTPTLGYRGRTFDVVISGDATRWSKSTTVDFGDKITVNEVVVASPTALHVNITAAADAATGYRDVKVTDGTSSVTYAGAFDLASPIHVSTPGDIVQGGLGVVHIQMLDTTTPFDMSAGPSGFANFQITLGGNDVSDSVGSISDYAVELDWLVDVLAPPGDLDLEITSGSGMTATDSSLEKAVTIKARTPTPLTSTPTSGTMSGIYDTKLFTFAPPDASLRFVQFGITSDVGMPALQLIPKSGAMADEIGFLAPTGGFSTSSTDPYYAVAIDGSWLGPFFGANPPYDYKVSVTATAVTEAAEAEGANGNNTPALANDVAVLPGLVTNGDVANGDQDVDYYKFQVTGAPKSIHVATGGDLFTDTALEVFGVDGVTSLGSVDASFQEDLTVTAPVDGTYFVKVSSGVNFFDPSSSKYQLFIETK